MSPGAVTKNYLTGYKRVSPSIDLYLKSPIGSCNDHAYILKILLKRLV